MTSRYHLAGLLLCSLAASAEAQDQARPPALKQLSIEELMRIDVTTVGRRAEPIGTTAAAASVITGDDIRRAGVTTIADALRLADGVHVAQSSNATWNITARGFNQGTANKLLVMIDGRTVYSPLFTGVFWNVVDYVLEDIDRIEVIRGPGATLWGANAVNGVVNIITKHSRDTQGAAISVSGGNEDRGILEARYGGALDGATWRVYGKFADRDAQRFASGLPSDDARRRGQAGFRVDGGNPDATGWMVKGDAFHSRDDSPGGTRESTELDLQTSWTHLLANASRVNLQSYYRREFRRQPGQLTHHVDILDVDAQHAGRVADRHDLIWGGGLRVNWDVTRGTAALRFDPAARTYGVTSLFVQDEIALLPDRWFTTVGVKWEHDSFSGGALQPSVRTRLMLPKGQVLWGALSRANRRPSRLEDDAIVPGPASTPTLVGNDDFLPEALLAAEAGYRVQPWRELSFDATLFRHDFTDLRSVDSPAVGATPLIFGNSFEGRSHGVELGINLQPVPYWRTHLGYTWLDTDVHARPGSRVVTAGASEANDPHHLLGIRTSVDLPRSIDLDASVRAVGALERPPVPAVAVLSLRVGWRATPKLELFLSGQDLLHDRHPEFGADGPTRVEIERSFRVGVTVRY
jgi:iron complex outermembrane receptor protein